MSLDLEITKIASEVISCSDFCDGILNDPQQGIIPRCLVLENENRQEKIGCVIVGINPGTSKHKERYYYQNNMSGGRLEYEPVMRWFLKHNQHSYNTRLKAIVASLGFSGPILWTELAKCESSQIPEPETLRHCANKFLKRELAKVPTDWPIFAVGRVTFSAVSFLFPEHAVIGVPHPTASRGHFANLKQEDCEVITNKSIATKSALWLK